MSYENSLKKNFLISILRTLYVRFKGVTTVPGRKSIKIRNRILMMKMRKRKGEKVRAVNVCICRTAIILGIF